MPEERINSRVVNAAIPAIHAALEHLIIAWDHLRSAEQTVAFEITTNELADLAGGIDKPLDVRRMVTFSVVSDWLLDIREAGK